MSTLACSVAFPSSRRQQAPTQQIQLDGFYRKMLQGVLQKLLSPAQSGICYATSVAQLPYKSARDLEQFARGGSPFTASDLPAFADAIGNLHGTINDREFLLEKVLTMMARLPDDSVFAKVTQQHVINLLYKDLPHPPTAFLSTFHDAPSTDGREQSLSYAFRSADGSNYNVLFPSLGQAKQPYARSVPSTRIQTLSSLPDPSVVFDDLLCRRPGSFTPHPGGLSSLFFAFADLIIHSIFNTNTSDWSINDTSSYLDLSIIYGSTSEQVDSLRTKDGTGKIWNDAFADSRLLFMPPSVGALAVLFSRHHNYIAQKILDLNERGSFLPPDSSDPASLVAQDDEIFHRARMVNTAFFMRIILADYVGSILGLVRDGLTWRLDPLAPFRESDHAVSPRGQGNAVAVEFNLLYRWHACISEQDEKWLNKTFKKMFQGKDPKTVAIKEFREVIRGKVVPSGDVKTWTFDKLKRGPDGFFSNEDLARILQDATERSAGAFGARRCPSVMKVVEILAIEQGRKWGVCTLNEFRRFIGLRPYESFEEWNPDKSISSAAENLYGHIDNLELHVGLQAEETKPPMPGAGLCPGYTISRAILADAVCLSRGDRYLTVDFTPYNLTNWGYQHCVVNAANGSYGGMLNRLLFQLLPDQYPAGSAYAHFPFMTPDVMRRCIASRPADCLTYYDFSRPSEIRRENFQLYTKRMSRLTKGVEVTEFREVRESIVKQTRPAVSFTRVFKSLVERVSGSGGQDVPVDKVKDVVRRAPIYWLANFVLGLPITELDGMWAGHTVERWSELFADVTNYMYLNDDPVHDWTLYQAALKATDEIVYYICNRLKRHSEGTISVGGASDMIITSLVTSNVQNDRFVADALEKLGRANVWNVAYTIFAETVPSALLFSKVVCFVVDHYGHASRKAALQELVQLSSTVGEDDAGDYDALVKLIDDALCDSSTAAHLKHEGGTKANGDHDGENRPSCLIIDDHRVDIRRLGGLMSQDLFPKLAPLVVAAIFSLKEISFADA